MSAATESTATHATGFRELSVSQRRQVIIGAITIAAGVAVVGAGIAAFFMRAQIAAWLGARMIFGTPVTDADSWKVLWVTLHCLGVAGYGLLTIVAGCVVALEVFVSRRRTA